MKNSAERTHTASLTGELQLYATLPTKPSPPRLCWHNKLWQAVQRHHKLHCYNRPWIIKLEHMFNPSMIACSSTNHHLMCTVQSPQSLQLPQAKVTGYPNEDPDNLETCSSTSVPTNNDNGATPKNTKAPAKTQSNLIIVSIKLSKFVVLKLLRKMTFWGKLNLAMSSSSVLMATYLIPTELYICHLVNHCQEQ